MTTQIDKERRGWPEVPREEASKTVEEGGERDLIVYVSPSGKTPSIKQDKKQPDIKLHEEVVHCGIDY